VLPDETDGFGLTAPEGLSFEVNKTFLMERRCSQNAHNQLQLL
jgi:hypothetical protein